MHNAGNTSATSLHNVNVTELLSTASPLSES